MIFSNFSPAATGDKALPQDIRRSSPVIYVGLSWELESLSSSFSLTTLSSNIRRNQPMSLYSLVFQKHSRESRTELLSSLLLISGWLGTASADTVCLYQQFTPWTIHAFFTTGKKRAISIFKSNQIKEPIPENPEPIQKNSSLKSCSSRTTFSTRICISQGSPEKQNQKDI